MLSYNKITFAYIFKHISLRLSNSICYFHLNKKLELEEMTYQYNQTCSKKVAKHWTPTAIECYRIGCNCFKCYLYKIYFQNSNTTCKMKTAVIELVRTQGVPQKEKVDEKKYL